MICPKDGCKLKALFGTPEGENGKSIARRASFECGYEMDIPSIGFWETVIGNIHENPDLIK